MDYVFGVVRPNTTSDEEGQAEETDTDSEYSSSSSIVSSCDADQSRNYEPSSVLSEDHIIATSEELTESDY